MVNQGPVYFKLYCFFLLLQTPCLMSFKAAVVGGGFAGLSCALTLGRCLVKTIVISEENPRNAATHATHGFLTRDGMDPQEFRKIGVAQLEKYKEYVTYKKGTVTDVVKEGDGFVVKTAGLGDFHVKYVVMATGLQDHVSEVNIKGLDKLWGNTLFPCPVCDGFEIKGKRLVLIGNDPYAFDFTKPIRHLTDKLTVITVPGHLKDEQKAEYKANGIVLVEGKITEVTKGAGGKGVVVLLEGGEKVEADYGFVTNTGEVPSKIPKNLGVPNCEWADSYDSTESGATNVPGLYVVGDLKYFFGGTVPAAAHGAAAAEAIWHEESSANWKKA